MHELSSKTLQEIDIWAVTMTRLRYLAFQNVLQKNKSGEIKK